MRLDLFGGGGMYCSDEDLETMEKLERRDMAKKRECCYKLRETWKDSGVNEIVFPEDFPPRLQDWLVLRASVCSDRGGSGPNTFGRVPAGAALDQTRDRLCRLTHTVPYC